MPAAWVPLSAVQFFPVEIAPACRSVRVTRYAWSPAAIVHLVHPMSARSPVALDAAQLDLEAWWRSPERVAA